VAGTPDEAELERLGLFDPSAEGAEDRLRLLKKVFGLGATAEEAVRAARLDGLGPLVLDLSTRPPGQSYDLEEFADSSGLDARLVRRLWIALGLPESGPVPLRVTPDAAEALQLLARATDLLGEETGLAFTRVVGASAARMAEAISDALRVGIETPQRAGGMPYSAVVDGYTEFAREFIPRFIRALAAIFQRQVVLVSYQRWSTDAEGSAVTLQSTIGFADLVESTQLLRHLSVSEVANMVERFESQAWELVTRAGGRVVKLIGDEVMFVLEDAKVACQVALELAERRHPVRVGIAHGEVVGLYGDYYGETVNLAARLVRAAEPSSVVASQSVAEHVQDGFRFEPMSLSSLKGFDEAVTAFRVNRI
jgi:class 3 adenylate cyclase